jgi:CBS domain-containing protein
VKDVMSTTLYPAAPEMSRDEAAEILQKHKIHHAVVQNVSGKFAGLLSSWDIARECALDAKVINVRDVQWVTHKR